MAAHYEELLQYHRERYARLRPLRNWQAREWRLANLPRYLLAKRAYYEANKDAIRQRNAVYRRENPALIRNQQNRHRARKAQTAVGRVSASWVRWLYAASGGICAYCSTKIAGLTLDHIVPLAMGGTHTADNLTIACKGCNSSKNDRPMLLWLLERHQLEAARC